MFYFMVLSSLSDGYFALAFVQWVIGFKLVNSFGSVKCSVGVFFCFYFLA